VRYSEESIWRGYATHLGLDVDLALRSRIERALASPAVATQRATLEQIGLRIDPEPILWKYLPGPHLRLFFPVTGEGHPIELGSVVAIVLLYDVATERTLYAHPVHAGPGANPLLKHIGGPMAQPKAQAGANGDRATLRLLEHKMALWACLERERNTLGSEEADRRWRERYAWALVRLYFCERCSACRWGSPFFDGIGEAPYRSPRVEAQRTKPDLPRGWQEIVAPILQSDIWKVEVAYARRGGFVTREDPQLLLQLDEEFSLTIFPTDAEFLTGGSIVALAVYFHEPTREVRYAFCLSAGPEAEMLFLHGDRAMGLPVPRTGTAGAAAREAYAGWRREAWSQFWLDELELGLHEASGNWLTAYWDALRSLVEGNKTRDTQAPAH
jgi:hypothetical protein